MRLTRKAVLAGIASLAVAGAAVAAEAPRFHTMTIGLPDGAIAHVRYSGDVPPTVIVDRAPALADRLGLLAGFDPEIDRIAAAMDREAAAMLRQVRFSETGIDGPAGAPGLGLLAAGGLPAGAAGYTFVSQTIGDGGCTRSVEITKATPGAKPEIVTHESGNCGASAPATPHPDANATLKPAKPEPSAPGSGRI